MKRSNDVYKLCRKTYSLKEFSKAFVRSTKTIIINVLLLFSSFFLHLTYSKKYIKLYHGSSCIRTGFQDSPHPQREARLTVTFAKILPAMHSSEMPR